MKPREPRRTVLIQARMRTGAGRVDICIRDISSRGALVQAASPPPRGTYVEIFLARHTIVGRVVWTRDRKFGLQTQERLDVIAITEQAALSRSSPTANPAGRRSTQPSTPSAAQVAHRLERSRHMSAALEFGCLAACSVAAAAFSVSVVFEAFSRPLESVASHLG
jgi:hypothetical protein